ncbi:MAG: hypothetical protein JNM79_01030 [Burkholderiales bacterium]|nr:hypothetical protein [Burkholderiales bacterium]
MLWNCPHCGLPISTKTIISTRLANEGNRRAMFCPHCRAEVEMNVNPVEYWQLILPVLGLLALWGASRNGSQASMVLAAVVVGAGFFGTIYVNKRLLATWQRFRKPKGPDAT